MNIRNFWILFTALAALASGQAPPSITNVTNGALPALDYPPATIHLAPRSIATIFGTGLADNIAVASPETTTLAGTEVHLASDTCFDSSCDLVSTLFYVSPTQINFLVPDNGSSSCHDCAAIAYRIVFVRNGQRIDNRNYGLGGPGRIFIDAFDLADYNVVFAMGFDCLYSYSLSDPSSCGFSSASGSGRAALGAITDAVSGQLITSQSPVHQGQIITLWMTAIYGGVTLNKDTGLLQQSNPAPIGFGVAQLGQDMANSITIGARGPKGAFVTPTPLWAGEAPHSIGLDQLNVAFPTCGDAPPALVEKRFDAFLTYSSAETGTTVRLYVPFVVRPGDIDCHWLLGSTTVLSSNINPSAIGQIVTFTATVSPSSGTGTITFFDGSTELSTVPLGPGLPVSGGAASGIAIYSTATLSAGSHSITAVYSGDPKYQSSSATVLQTVLRSTTTTVTSNGNPSRYGQAILTAAISPSDATGTVTFFAELNRLGTVSVINGTAKCSGAGLSIGTHSISATYSGDGKYAPSSATLIQIVIANTPTVTLTSNPSPSAFGQAVTLSASVCCGATGTVTFFDGNNALGSGVLQPIPISGSDPALMQTTFSTATLSVGTHSITARYNGDKNNNASTSGVVVHVVGPPFNSTITLSSNVNPSLYGQNITLTAVVAPSAATGTVTFFDGYSALATVPLGLGVVFSYDLLPVTSSSLNSETLSLPRSGGVGFGTATLMTSALSTGTHSIMARYNGDSNYSPSTSNVVLQTIGTSFGTTITLFSNISPSSYGQTVAFTAVVSPSAATGTVSFFDGNILLGTVSLGSSPPVSGGVVAGTAIFMTSYLQPGAHLITALYNGDGRYSSSVASIIQTVK